MAAYQWDNRVALAGGWLTWAELADRGPTELQRGRGAPVAVVGGAGERPWSALAAAVRSSADFLLVGDDRIDDELPGELADLGFAVLPAGGPVETPGRPAGAVAGRITVLTSGTTGRPKLVAHTLESLATMRGLSDAPPRRWLCPYAPGTYAWYQCAVLGLTVPGQWLVPVAPADDDWLEHAQAYGVDAVTATPTFWRRAFLLHDPERLRALRLRQVTLGGEPVSQSLLDRLRDLFPDARLTHIYASTEAGACIVVSDGRAGFPLAWLERGDEDAGGRAVAIRVSDDRLQVRSPFATPERAGEWLDTGDRVQVRGDRVEIVGRAAPTIINVGGAKVSALEVAEVLGRHPWVAWCRVRAKRAPVVGELPVAEVVPAANAPRDEAALIAWCRERLPEVAVPRLVRFRDEIATTAAAKSRLDDVA